MKNSPERLSFRKIFWVSLPYLFQPHPSLSKLSLREDTSEEQQTSVSTHTVPPPRARHEGFSVPAVTHTWRGLPCRGCSRDGPAPGRAGTTAPSVPPPASRGNPAAGRWAGRRAGRQGSWPCPAPGPWAPSPRLPAPPLCIPRCGPLVPGCRCSEEPELVTCSPRGTARAGGGKMR